MVRDSLVVDTSEIPKIFRIRPSLSQIGQICRPQLAVNLDIHAEVLKTGVRGGYSGGPRMSGFGSFGGSAQAITSRNI